MDKKKMSWIVLAMTAAIMCLLGYRLSHRSAKYPRIVVGRDQTDIPGVSASGPVGAVYDPYSDRVNIMASISICGTNPVVGK
jgi:hypothetical protein